VALVLSSAPADDVVVVHVRGELDVATAGYLWPHVSGLIERGQRHILIDCTQLFFLDCFGLSALLRCSRAAGLDGGWMRLCQIDRAVLRLLSITGLVQVFLGEDEIQKLTTREGPPASASGARR